MDGESATKTIEHCRYCKDGVDKRPVMTILHGIINSSKVLASERSRSIGWWNDKNSKATHFGNRVNVTRTVIEYITGPCRHSLSPRSERKWCLRIINNPISFQWPGRF